MAEKDEEEKVVPKKKDSNKIIILIGVALIVISLVISLVSLLSIMGLKKSMVDPEEEQIEEDETSVVSLLDIDIFDFSKNFIFIFEDTDKDIVNNVVVDISVGYLNTEKESAVLADTLSSKEAIIRDGIESLVKEKDFSDFKTRESMDNLKSEIKDYLQEILVTELILDVYFNNLLTTSR